MHRTERTRKLVESALMIAIGTVLSIIPIVEMPYGGSVTVASMLPVLLVAYRHGLGWGLGTGLTYAVLQQLLGLKNLTYFTTWQSVVAIILLDYLVAFAVIGLGGLFRRSVKRQNLSLALGGLLTCFLRYVCHVISGATVWAGLSIPTEAALVYSIGYNATYMIPETVVLVLVAYYLGSVLDFRREQPTRMVRGSVSTGYADLTAAIAGLTAIVAVAVDVSLVFANLQHPESGEFDVTLLHVEQFVGSFWMKVSIVTLIAAVIVVTLLLLRRRMLAESEKH